MIAGPELEKGPCTVGLNNSEFIKLKKAVALTGCGWFDPFSIALSFSEGRYLINWREGKKYCFAPVRINDLDYARLAENAGSCRRILQDINIPTASAVLLGLPGGDDYFRDKILSSFPPLVEALLTGLEQEFVASCRKIIGMGRGSTPTGDDLVHGALVAYHCFNYDLLFLDKIFAGFNKAAAKTNPMGRHMLETGRMGLTPEVFQKFILALACSRAEPASLQRMQNIGSSTGYDLMIGLLYFVSQMIRNTS